MSETVRVGLEVFAQEAEKFIGNGAVALVANPTSVAVTRDGQLRHAVDVLHENPSVNLQLLLGPEHGIRATAQDQIAVSSAKDPVTGLAEVSLYGDSFESLSPAPELLAEIDTLVFDVQDVGSRYYTYQATMALCMRVAAVTDTKVLVLDRPNPIGGAVEGSGIEPHLYNFCGIYPVPQRHGMTVGELARLYNEAFDIGCDLDVIRCEGWSRDSYFDDTGLPWVLPSPNMPSLDTAIVYPGTCLFEGATVSEGRGTTIPFQLFGAPYVDPEALQRELQALELGGVWFRPVEFVPTFHKYVGERCLGLQLHISDRERFLPYRTGLALLWALRRLWPQQFGWRTEKYEFRDDVPAIDLLTGCAAVRESIDAQGSFDEVLHAANFGRDFFDQHRDRALLY